MKAVALGLATCGAVVAIDQATKAIIESQIGRGDRVEVLPFLDFTNTRNDGVAFGLAGDVPPLLIGGALILLVGLLVFLGSRARDGAAVWLPAGLVLGGALSNLVDRIHQAGVTDFIDFDLWATFNLADVAIVAGVALLVLMPQPPPDAKQRRRRSPGSPP